MFLKVKFFDPQKASLIPKHDVRLRPVRTGNFAWQYELRSQKRASRNKSDILQRT